MKGRPAVYPTRIIGNFVALNKGYARALTELYERKICANTYGAGRWCVDENVLNYTNERMADDFMCERLLCVKTRGVFIIIIIMMHFFEIWIRVHRIILMRYIWYDIRKWSAFLLSVEFHDEQSICLKNVHINFSRLFLEDLMVW